MDASREDYILAKHRKRATIKQRFRHLKTDSIYVIIKLHDFHS